MWRRVRDRDDATVRCLHEVGGRLEHARPPENREWFAPTAGWHPASSAFRPRPIESRRGVIHVNQGRALAEESEDEGIVEVANAA